MSDVPPAPLRRDAARNRERLIEAARRLFAERGHDVALEEVARAAGVSRTTLYRNWATREELATTVFEDNAAQIDLRAAELVGQPDGAARLLAFILDLQLANRGLARFLSGADERWFLAHSRRVEAAFEPLLDQGWVEGTVRPETDLQDLMLAVSLGESVASVEDVTRRKERSRRLRSVLHRALFTGYFEDAQG
ncbi:helix-turn-helix domain-containing protein [Streptomyces sp. NPDC047081]|uniref:TetR/AcrR family transcriptional regulator n=1 Tax=Streptomyces sp. NPDC047081 TaxID=3154706 RepID=UPI0033CC9752